MAGDIKADARKVFSALNQFIKEGRAEILQAVVVPNAVDHNAIPGQAPGLEGVIGVFRQFAVAFPDLTMTIEDMIAEGDKVVCRVSSKATHKGEFMGLSGSGKQVSQTGIDILRIVDGKVVERWGQFDDVGLMMQLGLIKMPG